MPEPQDDPRYRGLKKAEGIGPQPDGGLFEMVGDMMTSSVGGRGFPSRLSPSGEGNPGPVDAILALAGGKLAKYLYGSATSKAGDAGIKAISKDPMALAKGPMDRRSFLYRSTPIPEKLRQTKVIQEGMSIRDKLSNLDQMAASGRDVSQDLKALHGKELSPEASDAINASGSLRQHFAREGRTAPPLMEPGQTEAEYNAIFDKYVNDPVWKRDQELTDAAMNVEDFPNLAKQDWGGAIPSVMQRGLAAEELAKSGPKRYGAVSEGPSALSGLLRRFGAEARPEIEAATKSAMDEAPDIEKNVRSAVQSVLDRFKKK